MVRKGLEGVEPSRGLHGGGQGEPASEEQEDAPFDFAAVLPAQQRVAVAVADGKHGEGSGQTDDLVGQGPAVGRHKGLDPLAGHPQGGGEAKDQCHTDFA